MVLSFGRFGQSGIGAFAESDWLQGLLMTRFFAPGLGANGHQTIDYSIDAFVRQRLNADWRLHESAMSALASISPRGDLFDINLPQELALSRTIKAPQSARGDLSEIVAIDIRQNTPMPEESIVWSYKVSGENRSHLSVEILIIRRSIVDAILSLCRDMRIPIRTISVANSVLWRDRALRKNASLWTGIGMFALLVSLGLSTASEMIKTREARQLIDLLKAENAGLAAEMAAHADRRHSLAASRRELSQVLDWSMDNTARANLLEKITEDLADETTLTDLLISGGKVTLTGNTSLDVASIAAELADRDWTETVRMSAPVTRDPASNRMRFQFQITLAPEILMETPA